MTLISVIIPCYNSERFVERAINSVLAQTCKEYEIIVIDDGSTDRTAEKVRAYGPAVRYLHQKNRGLPAARNTGIAIAQGEYIALLDDDDWWVPEKLERQIAVLSSHPEAALVYCDARVVYENGDAEELFLAQYDYGITPPAGFVREQLLAHNFILPSTVMMVRSKLNEVCGFDEEFLAVEDWDLWLRMASRWQVQVVRDALIFRREGSHNMTSNTTKIATYAIKALKKASTTLVLNVREKKLLRKKQGQFCWFLGYHSFRNGKFGEGRPQFLAAVRCNWQDWRSLLFWIASFFPAALLESVTSARRNISTVPSTEKMGA